MPPRLGSSARLTNVTRPVTQTIATWWKLFTVLAVTVLITGFGGLARTGNPSPSDPSTAVVPVLTPGSTPAPTSPVETPSPAGIASPMALASGAPTTAQAPSPTPTAGPTTAPKPTRAPTPKPTRAPAPNPTRAPTPKPTPPPTKPACGTLQARIKAAPAGSVLKLTGCTYTGGATVNKSLTIVGGTIRTSGRGLLITASNVDLNGLHIIGPQARSFHGREIGIEVAASAGSPVRNLTIRNSEIERFGKAAVWLRHVANLSIRGNDIHDTVYAGIMVLSGRTGRIESNLVQRIGVYGSAANEKNAYGISLSRITGTLSSDPQTSDFVVYRNTVQDIPTWHALDTHAGLRISFTSNTVRRASRGVFVTSDGGSTRSRSIKVQNNILASPSPVTFNLLAITTYKVDGVTVSGNRASGWGKGRFFSDEGGLSTNIVLGTNTVS